MGEPLYQFFSYYVTTRIGIFVIYMISKEINLGGNVFGPRVNILGLNRIYEYHIVLKICGLNFVGIKAFIQMLWNIPI